MRILQICVGKPRIVDNNGKEVTTSIFKSPVDGPRSVSLLNIDGDEQSDLEKHGGRDKAIYVYSADYYPTWQNELGVEQLEPSQFGQNLTVEGGTDDTVLIGSRYRCDELEVEVTQPRLPCFKLGIRLGDPDFANIFWNAGRLGFYLRVTNPGVIEVGQSFELVDTPDHGITLRRLYDVVMQGTPDEAQHMLDTLPGLSTGWQRRLRRVCRSGENALS